MIKRGLVVAPVLIAICGVIWGGDGAWSALYGIALVLANFAIAAGLIAMTARISLALMMARRAVRLPHPPRPDLRRRLRRQGRRVDFAPRPRSDHHRDAPRAPGLGAQVRRPLPGLSGPQAAEVRSPMLALEFPPINAIIRWQDLFPTFNKVALIAVVAALIGIIIFLLAGPRRPDGRADGRAQPGRDHRRVHRGPDRHADDGSRRARLDAVPAQPLHLHLPVQPAGHHPDPADAGDGPHRHPAVPRRRRVADRTSSSASSTTASATSPACSGRPTCRSRCGRSSASSSSSPASSCARSAWRSDSSPTCSPGTCCS